MDKEKLLGQNNKEKYVEVGIPVSTHKVVVTS